MQIIGNISTMGAPQIQNQLSANSKKLNRFQASQNFKMFLFLVIILVTLGAMPVGYSFYKNTVDPEGSESIGQSNLVDETVSETIAQDQPITPTIEDPASPSSPAGGYSPSSNPTQQPSAPSSGMPEGVSTALNSIEQSGIRNNSYIAIDTSSIPDGSTIKANRGSWSPVGADTGSVSGTITIYGQPTNGSLTFQLVGGVWKVVGYAIAS